MCIKKASVSVLTMKAERRDSIIVAKNRINQSESQIVEFSIIPIQASTNRLLKKVSTRVVKGRLENDLVVMRLLI